MVIRTRCVEAEERADKAQKHLENAMESIRELQGAAKDGRKDATPPPRLETMLLSLVFLSS